MTCDDSGRRRCTGRCQLSHQPEAFSGRRQTPFPAGFGDSTDMRDTGMCQHRGVKSPAGRDSLGKLVLPGWCNRLSSNTTLFLPTRSHHEAPLGQSHMSVSWKTVIRNLLERTWCRNQRRQLRGVFRKQAASVGVGMWTLHHGAVAKHTFGRAHWSR